MNGAAQTEQAGAAMIVLQPWRVDAVMLGRRAEVPHIRIAGTGQQAIPSHLVARPLAVYRRRNVADVVLIEGENGAEAGSGKRLARASEPVLVQPPEIDAFLEIDRHLAERHQRPVPVMLRIDVFWLYDFRLGTLVAHR